MRKKNGFIYPSDILLPLIIIIVLILSFYMMQKRNQELHTTINGLHQQIDQLEQQLQHEQLKYKMLYRDPVVRDAIESGG